MLITDEVIKKVENIFGFALYDWQVGYLKGKGSICRGQRANGKTFAYCLKLLLSDGRRYKKKIFSGTGMNVAQGIHSGL